MKQIFSDHGSQISAMLLGRKCDFYTRKLRGLWAVYNNRGHSQWKNVCERRVSLIKKLIKQGSFGVPGPQTKSIERMQLETAMSAAASMVNNTPYLSEENSLLLAPSDSLTPWKGGNPSVQELPPTKLKNLGEARRLMLAKQESMREIREEELRLEVERFRESRLKLGHNKKVPELRSGGVVLIKLNQHGPSELGIVTALGSRDVTVRLRGNRSIETSVGICIPLVSNMEAEKSLNKVGSEFTHFVSVELENELTFRRIEEFQEDLKCIPGIGEKMKLEKMHITLAVMAIEESEHKQVREKFQKVADRFSDLLLGRNGYMITMSRLGFGDHGVVWMELGVGKELTNTLREFVEDEMGEYLTDLRFSPHISIFKRSSLSDREKEQLMENTTRLGPLVAHGITLRLRKVKGMDLKPDVFVTFKSKSNE
jgi:2'-5' RNA ligase